MLESVVPALLVLGILGVFFGVALAFASKVFAVEVDPTVAAVLNALPGANCGACGFPGCEGLANAIAKGEAPVNGCAIGGQDTADEVAGIMGADAGEVEKEVAMVRCQGTCERTENKYNYHGIMDCRIINGFAQGAKSCPTGCLGGGTCVTVCEFDAIHVVDGVAVVDKEKCVACMKCIEICPKNLIHLVPYAQKTEVKCFSKDPGKNVRTYCTIGCIGCGICEKKCPKDAIHVTDNLAAIDYDKCINCGICAANCPTGAIDTEYPERVQKMKDKMAADRKKKAEEAKAAKAAKAAEAESKN